MKYRNPSKLILFVTVLIASPMIVDAATYYVDTSIDDVNSASATADYTTYNPVTFSTSTGSDSVYRSVADVSKISLLSGDNVFFRRGQTWYESLTAPAAGSAGNPITFGAFGSGSDPVLNGADLYNSSWMAYPGNIVANGDFERWDSGTSAVYPLGWAGGGLPYISQSASVVHGGNYSLHFSINSANTDTYVSQTMAPMAANTTYNVSLWHNIPSGKTAKLTIRYSSGYINSSGTWQAGATYITLTGTGSWTQYSISFTTDVTTPTSPYINIERLSAASSDLYFDDLVVQPSYPSDTHVWGHRLLSSTGYVPTEAWFNGSRGNKVNATSSLAADGDWYADYANQLFWVYSSTAADPATIWSAPGIEVNQRSTPFTSAKDYVSLENMRLTKGGGFGASIAATANASYDTLSNVEIDYNYQSGIHAGSQPNYSADYLTIDNFNIHDNGDNDSLPQALYHGIYLSNTNNSLVENGSISDQRGGYGIQIQDSADANTVRDVTISNNYSGGIVIYNNATTMPTGNIIYNNIFTTPAGVGVRFISVGGTASASDVNYIYNNTFFSTSTDIYAKGVFKTNDSSLESKGNLIYVTGNAQSQTISDTGGTTIDSDYNYLGPEASNYITANSSSYSTLGAYSTAIGSDTHSTTSDPLTVSDMDYHLQTLSPLIDTGVSTTTRITDFSGNPIYGTPDIGAYEYQPPFTLGTDKIDPTGNIRIYGDKKYRYTTATSSTMLANFSVSPAEGSWTYSASSSRPEWLNISNITWNTSGDYSKSWTASSSSATTTVYTVGDLLPDKSYLVSVDGAGTTTSTTDSSGILTYTYTGGYSTHTFGIEAAPTVESSPAPASSGTSVSSGSSMSPQARRVFLENLYSVNGLECPQNICQNDLARNVKYVNNVPNTQEKPHFAYFNKYLSAGIKGPEVKRLQRFLNATGYTLAKDGPGSPGNETDFFGSLTYNAVIRFQRSFKLPKTGFFGPLSTKAANYFIDVLGYQE